MSNETRHVELNAQFKASKWLNNRRHPQNSKGIFFTNATAVPHQSAGFIRHRHGDHMSRFKTKDSWTTPPHVSLMTNKWIHPSSFQLGAVLRWEAGYTLAELPAHDVQLYWTFYTSISSIQFHTFCMYTISSFIMYVSVPLLSLNLHGVPFLPLLGPSGTP